MERLPRSGSDPLSALQAGDGGPFERFVRREARAFFGFFRNLGSDPGEAEDLAQEVFLRLYQSADSYRPSGRFLAYAYRVARNVWVDRTRRRGARAGEGAREGTLEDDPVSGAPGPGRRAEEDEEAARVRAAVADLPEPHRLVFELAVVRELPYAEVGDALGIPAGTVKSRMFYALRRLRARLHRDGRTPSNAESLRGELVGRAGAGRAEGGGA